MIIDVYTVFVRAVPAALCLLICTYFTRNVGSWVHKVCVFV